MPVISKCVYVVSCIGEDGRILYYVRQKSSFYEEGNMVVNEPIGIFSTNLADARKFTDRAQAEWTASYFEDARVEMIKQGEKLK